MVGPATVPGLEHPSIPPLCQPPCICRAGGRLPKSQLAKRLAVNLRVQMRCCQRPARGACVSVWCGCWGAWRGGEGGAVAPSRQGRPHHHHPGVCSHSG